MTPDSPRTLKHCLELSRNSPAFRICVAVYKRLTSDLDGWFRQQAVLFDRLALKDRSDQRPKPK